MSERIFSHNDPTICDNDPTGVFGKAGAAEWLFMEKAMLGNKNYREIAEIYEKEVPKIHFNVEDVVKGMRNAAMARPIT